MNDHAQITSVNKKNYLNKSQGNNSKYAVVQHSLTNTNNYNSNYQNNICESIGDNRINTNSTIENIAAWFLSISPLTHKKLQKLCYYAYCWYIVFFNDIEAVESQNRNDMNVLCSDKFQAWIHGPVSPKIYQRYKNYGWKEIPISKHKPTFSKEVEVLLTKVWGAYGSLSAEQLESLSHQELPWKNARKGYDSSDACSNEISDYDILMYFSKLSK